MDTIPVASFIAGSLLTLLLPTLLLISIVAWYHVEAKRVPKPPTPPSKSPGSTDPQRPSSPTSPGSQSATSPDLGPGGLQSGESPPSGA